MTPARIAFIPITVFHADGYQLFCFHVHPRVARIACTIPPGDEKYFRLAMDVAQSYRPLEPHEEQALLSGGAGLEPIFKLGNDV